KMEDVSRNGRTVLFVSHQIPTIERLCNKAVLLNGGQVLAKGAVGEVIRHYLESGSTQRLSWERSGIAPSRAHVRAVRLCNRSGETLTKVTCADTPVLEIDAVVPENRSDLMLALSIHDGHERAIFASAPGDVGVANPTRKGQYRYRATLPGPILMPQHYSIT